MLSFQRLLIVYVVAIPLALMLGYFAATPDVASIAVVVLVLFVLALPLLMQWSHGLVIFFWNSAFIAGFLPGQMHLWVVFAVLTFGLGVINHVMGHGRFLRAPELTKPILFLLAVMALTAKIRGGVGVQALGSGSFGGRHYIDALAAIIGYFALTSQPVSISKSARAVKLFFLSEVSFGLCNVIYVLGPTFYFLYYLVSSDYAYNQAAADYGVDIVRRFGGLGPCGTGLLCFVLARWGVRGSFRWDKPWRLLLLMTALGLCMFSGFRSEFAFLCVLLFMQFMVEGLWRTALLPAFLAVGILLATPVLVFANKMPLAVQRALSAFSAALPLNINADVQAEAAGSTQWRLDMWRLVWPEVPRYLLVGKGYAIDPTDLYLAGEAVDLGLMPNYTVEITAGDYHNGPLSVLVPFGIGGALAFLWLLGAGLKALYCNRRYGDARLKLVNDFLFGYFLTECLFFFFVFGDMGSQLSVFLGILGLSVSLNGGVCRKPAVARQPAVSPSLAAPVAVA
jgi:hypothetical protein